MIREGQNRCVVKGQILHQFIKNNGSIVVTIGTGGGNKPNVVLHNDSAKYFKENYKVGDFILIEGNIQSSYSPGKGIRISIIVDRILPLGNTHRKYENYFEVYGTIKSIVNFGNMHKVNVITVARGHASYVPITFNYFDYRLNGETGEPIRISGVITTSCKEVNGQKKYYQNYVANGVM